MALDALWAISARREASEIDPLLPVRAQLEAGNRSEVRTHQASGQSGHDDGLADSTHYPAEGLPRRGSPQHLVLMEGGERLLGAPVVAAPRIDACDSTVYE